MSTAATQVEALQERVARLLRQWRVETVLLSSTTVHNAHPAYQEIISLGQAALPYLFDDLEQTHDGHLSRALTAITGAHPVPPEARGKIREIAEAWLRWAADNRLRS